MLSKRTTCYFGDTNWRDAFRSARCGINRCSYLFHILTDELLVVLPGQIILTDRQRTTRNTIITESLGAQKLRSVPKLPARLCITGSHCLFHLLSGGLPVLLPERVCFRGSENMNDSPTLPTQSARELKHVLNTRPVAIYRAHSPFLSVCSMASLPRPSSQSPSESAKADLLSYQDADVFPGR